MVFEIFEVAYSGSWKEGNENLGARRRSDPGLCSLRLCNVISVYYMRRRLNLAYFSRRPFNAILKIHVRFGSYIAI